MDSVKSTNLQKNMILKAWARCKSLGSRGNRKCARNVCNSLTNSRSWHCTTTRSSSREEDSIKKRKKKVQVAPQGCFSVYVGQEQQRFVMKTEFANHPLFKVLLEDAELEYGFNSEGPLLLPCDVDLFCKVLAEMDSGEEISTTPSWSSSLLVLCSPSCYTTNKRSGAYRLLSPSKMLKLNRT